ncbi:MAG TPA: DUF4178 domain-containing protein [Bryobacteraceae bacterium]|nr:DUF4178 domain-containing protein [Bryobacteraceae bacterium]
MITTTLLIVLGIALVAVIGLMLRPQGNKQAKAVGGKPPVIPISAGGSTDLLNARPGDVISVHAAAQDFSDVDFTVDRRSAYQFGGRKWTDLSGEFRGQRVYLEVGPGPDPEITGMLNPRELTLADVGATEEQMADLDAKQNPALYLDFEGKRWHYESSRELGYFENETGPGEGLYRWVFKEADGNRLLVMEKWEGEPFEGRIGQRLRLADVSVFRAA